MNDQANELRFLVQQGRNAAARPPDAPYVLAVAGGKGGVGTTTLALNLSVALIDRGYRTVLIDGDFQRADATKLCGLSPEVTVAQVLEGSNTAAKALARGPAGMLVLPGVWAPHECQEPSTTAQARLLSGIAALGDQAEVVVIDAGNGFGRVVSRFWNAADQVLISSTPDDVSLMDAYAAIKVLYNRGRDVQVRPVLNQVTNPALAADVAERLMRSCWRFLGLKLEPPAQVPLEPRLIGEGASPYLWELADSAAGTAVQQLAETVTDAATRRSGNVLAWRHLATA